MRLNYVSHEECVVPKIHSLPNDAASGGQRSMQEEEVARAFIESERATLVVVLSGNSAALERQCPLVLVQDRETETAGLFEQGMGMSRFRD